MFLEAAAVSFDKYDVIIVGSGPAGISLAKQLEARGKRCIIIETGLLEYDSDVHDLFSNVRSEGHYSENHWKNHWVRALGGTSAFWGGWCAPLSQRNLKDWPIGIEDITPYYPAASNILVRPDDFLTYEKPSPIEGFVTRPFSFDDPVRMGETYAEDFAANEKIDVLLGASVTEVFANVERNRLTGFAVFTPEVGRADITLRQDQDVVLAAGGIGNVQLLLASRSQGDVAIGNENDQVGRYLMEHPHFYGCARMVVSERLALDPRPEDFWSSKLAIVPTDAMYARHGGLDVSFQLSESLVSTDDNVEQHVSRQHGGAARGYDITVRSEMTADPLNRVVLTVGNDPAGIPLTRARCVIGSNDLRTVDDYLRTIGVWLAQQDYGRLRIDNDAIYREAGGGGHILGTTRMGDNPAISVVDKNCRVHGYDNLFVAGSSVFTTGGYANPTLTIVALALRLGDFLGDRS